MLHTSIRGNQYIGQWLSTLTASLTANGLAHTSYDPRVIGLLLYMQAGAKKVVMQLLLPHDRNALICKLTGVHTNTFSAGTAAFVTTCDSTTAVLKDGDTGVYMRPGPSQSHSPLPEGAQSAVTNPPQPLKHHASHPGCTVLVS